MIMMMPNYHKTDILMKRFLFILTALLAVHSVQARTFPYLSFQKTDGTVWSVGAESLQMTFSHGTLHVMQGAESYDLDVKDLSRMFFTESSMTGMDAQSVMKGDSSVQVYTVAGVCVGHYADMQSFKRSSLKGVYLVKVNGETIKMVLK